jgi:hypothetical protein
MQQQRQQGGLKHDLNAFIGIAQALELMLLAWCQIPSTCGSQLFRGQALLGWCISFVLAAFSRNEQLMAFVLATGAWMSIHKQPFQHGNLSIY